MRVAQKFAGYSLAEADNLRKACGKKKRELMAIEREKFVAGCEATGYGSELGTEVFDVIEAFADYAFAKSHSFGYGLITYQTAYLKAHHPVEYLAALLTSVKANLDKAAVYLAECRAMGIPVLVPDVNRSSADFVAARLDDGQEVIPFGLAAVRNVGSALVDLIVAEREATGPFTSFLDFCDRVPLPVLNKKTLEALIKAGGVRLARPPAPRAAGGVRVDRRPDRRPPPRGRHGRDDALRRRRRGRQRLRRPAGHPRPPVREGRQARASRRRCSASTSATTR